MYMVPATSPAREQPGPAEMRDLADSLVELLDTAKNEIERDCVAAKALIDRACLLLQIEIERSAAPSHGDTASGGLAAWQVHRVQGFIEGHLDEVIRIEDLSEMVRLSATHFSHAFKRSIGEAPHTYLVQRRLDRARHLMLTSDTALSEVALVCGFSDQAHFSRLFRRYTGESPAAWRRERREALKTAPPVSRGQPRVGAELLQRAAPGSQTEIDICAYTPM
jgi:AraC family transcriptional regulator